MPPPRQPQRGNTALWVALGVVLALVVAGGGAGLLLWQRSRTQTPTRPVATATAQVAAPTVGSGATAGSLGGASDLPGQASEGVGAPTTQAVPGSGGLTEQEALTQLGQLREQSLQRVVLDGRWVAQVASKSVGITDPLQTTAGGSHTFFAVDILAESLGAQNTVADPDRVYVLWGTDFGKRSQAADGSPYWVTVVDDGFSSSGSVTQWCQATYTGLTSQQLADTCVPRQLTPSHN